MEETKTFKPYTDYPSRRDDEALRWLMYSIAVGGVALAFFIMSAAFSMHSESYNRAMVACLAEHSKDVCVETLR